MKQLPTIDFGAREQVYRPPSSTNGDLVLAAFNMLQQHCHAASYNRGWWMDPVTGLNLIPGDGDVFGAEEDMRKAWFPYVVATKIALIHSEVSEMLESHRTGEYDDKIPFPGVVAEGADTMIRIFDLISMMQRNPDYAGYPRLSDEEAQAAFSLGEAILAKIPFNGDRADHSLAARLGVHGKKY